MRSLAVAWQSGLRAIRGISEGSEEGLGLDSGNGGNVLETSIAPEEGSR
jgi:hypothetical protein